MKNDLHVQLVINVITFPDGDYYIAYSPELDISTYARTKEDVNKRFEERLTIFFETASRKKNLFKQLKELGWKIHDKPNPELIPPDEVKIPLHFLKARHYESHELQYSI